ncbi:hypothetical protein [Desulfoscipio gibsoniae]
MATDKRSIRFPLPLSQKIIKKATTEHRDFTSVVIDLCKRQLEEDSTLEKTRAAALYSRAAFLASSELLALAKKVDVETMRRALLAKAGRRENRDVPGPGTGVDPGFVPGPGQG